jgi:hypothetical protein
MTVFGYVVFIVIVDESAMVDLPEDSKRCQRKKKANQ